MTLSQCRYAKVDQTIHPPTRVARRASFAAVILLAFLNSGCGEASKGTDANSSAGSTARPGATSNSNSGARAAGGQPIEIKELERYSIAMTISIQEMAAAPMLTQELSLAKLGADRRWALVVPALGQVVYLEKSGLRYLVLFERKQYSELNPNAFGFEPAKVLTPNSIAERLRSHIYEKLGLEPVNGRTAIKYRVTEPVGASTQTDGIVFVDQETQLPLRSELNTVTPSGTKARAIVDVRDVQLNPDRAQFDVPSGMKKITQQEASQQVEAFAKAFRSFADNVSGTPSGPVAGVPQPAANKNAGRSGR